MYLEIQLNKGYFIKMVNVYSRLKSFLFGEAVWPGCPVLFLMNVNSDLSGISCILFSDPLSFSFFLYDQLMNTCHEQFYIVTFKPTQYYFSFSHVDFLH